MVLKCVIVFDQKSESYESPQFVRATGEAIRTFQSMVNDGKSIFSKHPGDFILFELGEFNERTGEFIIFDNYKRLGSGLDYLTSDKSASRVT